MPLLQNTSNLVPNRLRIPVRLYPSISPQHSLTGLRTVTIVVLSRLAYRKGIDLLVATAPRICALFPNVNFVVGESFLPYPKTRLMMQIGGDGPKLIDLLQMREKHLLQDRIELLGPIRPADVLSVSPPLPSLQSPTHIS